jgi:hypothetical protein
MLLAELGTAGPVAARTPDPASQAAGPSSGPVWTEAALKRLDRVPEGFMRNAAKGMVEEHAKAAGLVEITLEAAEAGLGKAREKMHAAMVPGHAAVPTHGTPMAAQPAAGAWECHLCGLVVDGARPGKCSNCGTGHFTAMSADQRAKAHPSAFRALEWDEAARVRLERVPQGFMRDMTRMRVEKWARSGGADKVTLEVMDGKYGGWAEGGAAIALELEWSEEASARAERIPEFIRPMVKKEIERRVKAKGGARVEPADMDQAMDHWSGSGNFHDRG